MSLLIFQLVRRMDARAGDLLGAGPGAYIAMVGYFEDRNNEPLVTRLF